MDAPLPPVPQAPCVYVTTSPFCHGHPFVPGVHTAAICSVSHAWRFTPVPVRVAQFSIEPPALPPLTSTVTVPVVVPRLNTGFEKVTVPVVVMLFAESPMVGFEPTTVGAGTLNDCNHSASLTQASSGVSALPPLILTFATSGGANGSALP